jgi:predicted RNase H-like HicB family nuclease
MRAKEIVFLVEEDEEGVYAARALGHSIFTEGETWEELKEMVRDAVHAYFEPEGLPALIRLHLVRQEVLAP